MLYVKPSGLYSGGKWDERRIARLIIRGELAPRHDGADELDELHREFCPICFLAYPVLNKAQCCEARLCTECFLHMKTPGRRRTNSPCPFCKTSKLSVCLKDLPSDEVLMQLEENKRRSEAAAIRQQQNDECVDSSTRCSLPISSVSEEDDSCPEFENQLISEFEYLLSEAIKRSIIEQ